MDFYHSLLWPRNPAVGKEISGGADFPECEHRGQCHPVAFLGLTGKVEGGEMRAEGFEPSRAFAQRIFVPSTAFAAPPLRFEARWWVCGLDYPFTVPRISSLGLGAARLVSTPSRLESSGRAWFGIAISQVSPNLGSSASPVSRRALKFCLKSVASAVSATPASGAYDMAAKRNLQSKGARRQA